MSSSSHLRTVQWRDPTTKARLTLTCAPPHEDGRLRVICDLCAKPCVVASATQLGNFAMHRGSGACAKRAGVAGASTSTSASGSAVKSGHTVAARKSGGAGKGKITSHFAPSTSSRASSAAISIASASPPVTASSTSPQARPMEIDLTSPSPEPEPAPKKSKITVATRSGATAATARVVDTSLLDRLEARADAMNGPGSASSESLRAKSIPEAASTSATTSKPKPAQPISAISIPAAPPPATTTTLNASSSGNADVPACTVCKRPNLTPTYQLCDACRKRFRERSRIQAEKKRAAEAGAGKPGATSYEAAAAQSTSSSAHSTPATKTVSIPAAQTYSTPTSDLPACTSCRRPNHTPKYKLCDACRDYSRQRSRIDAERKRASAALLLAEARGDKEEIKRAREEKDRAMAMLPKRRDEEGEGGVEKKKPGRKRKRTEEHSPSPFRTPDILFDPDECGTAAAAYAILKSALISTASAPLPNVRLTWAVVADGSVSHRMRIDGVVRELRRVGVKFSSLGKTQEPGSSRYAPYNVITDRFRCKCSSSSKPVVRRQSNLSNFFTKNAKGKGPASARMEEEEEIEEEDVLMLVPSALVKGTNSTSTSTSTSTSALGVRKSVAGGAGGAEAEEKCGGHVYVSSEWDVKSHPAGLRGQRVVVWVVHEGGDDPVQ